MDKTLEIIEKKPEVQQLSRRAIEALKYAEKKLIRYDDERESATEFVVNIRDEKNKADKLRKFFTDPLNEQVKKINALFMPNIKTLDEAENILRGKLGKYQFDQEAIAEKARAKVEKDLEDGKIKNVATAVKKLENIVEPEKTQRTAAATTTYRSVPRISIVDANLLPREFLMPDLKKIETVALAAFKAGTAQIPGIEIKVEKVPSFRT